MNKKKVVTLEILSIRQSAIIGLTLNILAVIMYNSIFSVSSVGYYFLVASGVLALAYLISIPILKKTKLTKIISWIILFLAILQIILIVTQFTNIYSFFNYPIEILTGIIFSLVSMTFSVSFILKAYNKKLSKDAAWLTMLWQSP